MSALMPPTPSTPARKIAKLAHIGPLDWRKLVEWLSEDGIISPAEAARTIARCAQVQSLYCGLKPVTRRWTARPRAYAKFRTTTRLFLTVKL